MLYHMSVCICDMICAGWMIVNCPFSCSACHLRDREVRCHKDFLNMSHLPPAFAENGDVDTLFTHIVEKFGEQMAITVHSRDPWVLTFDSFMSAEEADAMIATVRTWERSTDTGAMNAHGETGRKLSTGRTSSNAWCRKECEDDPHVQNVMRRIEEVTAIPFGNSESFQILRYVPLLFTSAIILFFNKFLNM
jgi:prolyl 4-hydroxylase